MTGLGRFKEAQAADYETALAELRRGQKTSHWIWYVFPQIAELGRSSTARFYGIRDIAEAKEYLRDPILRQRLLEVTRAVADHLGEHPLPLDRLMGSGIDALKLVSSLTLFRRVAEALNRTEPSTDLAALASIAAAVLAEAARQGYPECAVTLARLA